MRTSLWACLVAGVVWGGGLDAQQVTIPPDTVTTLMDSDTIPGFGAVGGVTADALGYVYIADFRNTLWRMDPDGRVEKFADGFYGASGNAVGPRGEIYQSSFNGNYLSRISRTGEVERWVDEGLSGPVGIAVGPEGELYVCNCSAGTIARVDPDRSVTTFADHELLSCPNGIAFDDRGDLHVVNFNNTHVVRITPEGEVSSFARIPGGGGNGHIVFARGAFWVTKFRGHQVFRLSRDGTSTVVAGTGTAGEEDGPASAALFTRPNGIAATPSGKVLWVNDLVEGQAVSAGPSRVTLRRIRLVTLSDVLAGVEAGDQEALRATYAAYGGARPREDSSADASALAFQWLSNQRVGDALVLLELNARTDSPRRITSVSPGPWSGPWRPGTAASPGFSPKPTTPWPTPRWRGWTSSWRWAC